MPRRDASDETELEMPFGYGGGGGGWTSLPSLRALIDANIRVRMSTIMPAAIRGLYSRYVSHDGV
jgi:hypothetical protein